MHIIKVSSGVHCRSCHLINTAFPPLLMRTGMTHFKNSKSVYKSLTCKINTLKLFSLTPPVDVCVYVHLWQS